MATESIQCRLYFYEPSLSLALVAVILYSILTTAHSMRMTDTEAWSGIYFVIGGLTQTSGYIARLYSTQNPCNRVAYGIQYVLLVMGPTLLMFTVNLTMTEFARALRAERFCWIPINSQRPLYLAINCILLVVQAIGGILTVSTVSLELIEAATKLQIAIYTVQFVFWLFTFAEHIYVTRRLRGGLAEASKSSFPNWKRWVQLFGLAVSIIATGRNIMRLTMCGGIAFLIENEWPSYAFDGYQMVVVMGAWAIWYLPARCRAAMDTVTYMGLPILHTRDSRDSRGGGGQRRYSRQLERREERLHRDRDRDSHRDSGSHRESYYEPYEHV